MRAGTLTQIPHCLVRYTRCFPIHPGKQAKASSQIGIRLLCTLTLFETEHPLQGSTGCYHTRKEGRRKECEAIASLVGTGAPKKQIARVNGNSGEVSFKFDSCTREHMWVTSCEDYKLWVFSTRLFFVLLSLYKFLSLFFFMIEVATESLRFYEALLKTNHFCVKALYTIAFLSE